MSARKVYHVTRDSDTGTWKVTLEGGQRASATSETKAQAVERAIELAKAADLGQVKIHGTDGRIQTEHTYGKDPTRTPG